MAFKVAVTSSDGQHIDQHFGHAGAFYIFEVDETGGSFIQKEIRHLELAALESAEKINHSGCGHSPGQLQKTVQLLSGCSYLLTAKIGGKPQYILRRQGIIALETDLPLPAAFKKLNAYYQKNKGGK